MSLVSTKSTPAIQDLAQKSFLTEIAKPGSDVRRLFHLKEADWSTNVKRIHEFDRERYAEEKVEGQKSAQRGVAQGYYKDIKRKTISITRLVSGEQFKALTEHDLANFAMNVAKDVRDKIELDMLNFLGYSTVATSFIDNGGFPIDTTVGDGYAVFHTAHTLKNSVTTYSNILTGAPSLSTSSLADAEDHFTYNVMDNYGKRIQMKPNTVITSEKAVMVHRVARIFGSDAPESIEGTANANSGVKNTFKNRYKHLALPFDVNSLGDTDATKSFYWFLAALGGAPEESFAAYYVRWMSPMAAPTEVDQDAWVLSQTARASYGIGAVSGKGILVSKANN